MMPKQDILGKKVVFIIAFRGFRDEEYFIPKKILEDSGAETKTASDSKGLAIGSLGGEAAVDLLVSEVNPNEFDAVVFVGGPGCLKHLDNNDSYTAAQKTVSLNKLLSSICISPVILAKAGLLKEKKATVWSSVIDKEPVKILQEKGAIYQDKSVVVDQKLITANGPDAAEQFAKAIITALK